MHKFISNKRLHIIVFTLLFGLVGAFLMAQGYAAEWDDDDDRDDDDEIISLQVTPNPVLTRACGLDIALVLDHSGSIDQGAPRMHMMRDAMIAFVNALGATTTQFSLTKFAGSGVMLQPFTTNYGAITSSIASLKADGFGTNWSDGLRKAQGTFDPRPDRQNLIIFATDGEPTRPGGEETALSEAFTAANAIKASGIRILVLGIGTSDSISPSDLHNLQQISGTNLNTGDLTTTDVTTTSFDALASHMSSFAGQGCGTPANIPGPPQGPGPGPSGGGGSRAVTQSPEPSPAPAPADRGENVEPPKPEPSAFLDGQLFKPGSSAGTTQGSVSKIGKNILENWYYVAGGVVLVGGAGGLGYWYWRQKHKP